jgi:subtilase family serine protease
MRCITKVLSPVLGTLIVLALLAGFPLRSRAAGSDQTLAWLDSPASVPSRVTESPDDNVLTTLKGNLHSLAKARYDQGRVSDNLPMEHIIMLLQRSPEQETMLTAVIDGMHNRRSPLYHHWLSAKQFGQHFGPSDSDIAVVLTWLQGHGFKIDQVTAGKTAILFSGTAGEVRNAFHTEIHNLNVNGTAHISNMSEPRIPAALAPVVKGFRSLNNFFPKPMLSQVGLASRDPKTGKVHRVGGPKTMPELTTSGGEYLVGPQDFYTIYNENPLLTAATPVTGAGVRIAVIEETDVCNGQAASPCNGNDDDATFRSQFGLAANQPNYLFGISGYCTDPGILTDGEEGEAALDVQWSGAVAPGATVDFVSCATTSTSAGTDLSAMYIVNTGGEASMSYSYGFCELEGGASADAFYTDLWQQAAAQGQTVVISSGDQGSMVCDGGSEYGVNGVSVNAIAASIYNVSAGGTDFSDVYQTNGYVTAPVTTWWNATASTSANGYESAVGYVPEITWGGYCSSPLTTSFLQNIGNTTWGTTYTPEAVCNYSYVNSGGDLVGVVGGSGGISIYNSIPTWQAVYGVGSSSNSSSTTQRNQPDVSLFAANGFWGHSLVFCESDAASCDFSGNSGDFAEAGGTSFVAPQINGVMALVGQATSALQGNANYTFYNIAAGEYGTPGSPNTANLTACSGSSGAATGSATCIFQDIASDTPNPGGGTIASDNAQPCQFGTSNCFESTTGDFLGISSTSTTSFVDAYPVSQGYDLGTGLGSLNINNLVSKWNTASTGFPSNTTIVANPATFQYSSSTILTATVAATGRGGFVAPLGMVNFADSTNSATLGSAPLSASCTGAAPNVVCVGTASLTVPGTSFAGGSNTVTASFPGDGANDLASQNSTTVNVLGPQLSLSASPGSSIVLGGQPATFSLTVTSSEPFTGSTTFSCSGQLGNSCTFSPASVSSYPATVTMTVATSLFEARMHRRGGAPWLFTLVLPGLLLFPAGMRNRRRIVCVLGGLTLLLALSFAGCATATIDQPYPVTVTAQAPGAFSGSTIVTVTVHN